MAAFPVGVGNTCDGGPLHPDETTKPLPDNVRAHVDDTGSVSCEFARKVQSRVNTVLTSDPKQREFSFDETSHRESQRHYTVACTRANHLSRCAIQSSAPHNYVLYIRDSNN